MRERIEPISRVICMALGVLLLFQLVRVVARPNPLRQLAIPTVPTLSAAPDGESPGKATNAPRGGVAIAPGPQQPSKATNAPAGSVAIAPEPQSPSKATNAPSHPSSLSHQSHPEGQSAPKATNAPTGAVATASGPQSPTKTTNAPTGGVAVAAAPPGNPRFPGQMPGGPNRPGGPPGMGQPVLPPAAQARVDRIVQSEIFGPVPKPPPMALLGIAGRDAFLRGPDGQTGLVKEGDALGGLKLLKIGTNRVLVEQDGQTKELTVFSGFGSETLLPKGKENPQ